MPLIANFAAWIQVDGRILPEYGLWYSRDGKNATCWIPSEVPKQFEIGFSDSERAYPSAATVYVDGTRCNGKIIYGTATHPRRSPVAIQPGVKVSDGSYRPFVFSKCDLVEDETLSSKLEVGTIKVVVHEVKPQLKYVKKYNPSQLPPLQVNERLKKGIVHGTQLGPEIRGRSRQPRKTSKIREVASFVFQYRPLALLQAADLVPVPTGEVDHPADKAGDPVKKERSQTLCDVKTEVKSEDLD